MSPDFVNHKIKFLYGRIRGIVDKKLLLSSIANLYDCSN